MPDCWGPLFDDDDDDDCDSRVGFDLTQLATSDYSLHSVTSAVFRCFPVWQPAPFSIVRKSNNKRIKTGLSNRLARLIEASLAA